MAQAAEGESGKHGEVPGRLPPAPAPQTFTPATAPLPPLPDHQHPCLSHLPHPLPSLGPPPALTAPDLEGGLSIVILHILVGSSIEEDPSAGLLQAMAVAEGETKENGEGHEQTEALG